MRHGIASVYGEIEQDLVKLGRVARDGPEFIGYLARDPDVAGKGFAYYPLEIVDQVPQPDGNPLAVNSTREGKHLAHQVGPTSAADVNSVEDLAAARIGAGFELEQLDRHHDGGEYIVQVVGDAARERSDALHPLGAQELGLHCFLL